MSLLRHWRNHDRTEASPPGFVGLYYLRGLEKEDAGDVNGAIAEYTRALKSDPKHGAAAAKLKAPNKE